MNILKKRVNGTSIVLVGEKMYTRTDVSDSLWIEILEQIDKVNSVCEDSEKLAEEMECLMLLIDPERVKKVAKQAEVLEIAIRVGGLEPVKEDRLRKAKRMTDISGIFEHDDDGLIYLKGFDHVMPKIMVDAILDAHYNPNSQYTVSSLLNFWKYLLLNPDKHVRQGLFEWIKTGKFAITEDGNIISYRNVDIKQKAANIKLYDFVMESVGKVKRWKKSPKNYSVYNESGEYKITELGKYTSNGKFIGNLHDLSESVSKEGGDKTIYEPQHKGPYGQTIIIGEPVSMPRSECDNDPMSSCSRGLHQKSISYGMGFGNESLVCLTNPYNVVAIPNGEFNKFRCCEYLPVAKAEIKDGQIVEFEPGTYDLPYNGIENLSKLLGTKSLAELKATGEISDEISDDDMSAVMTIATEVIGKRVVKVQ